jgi:hypothetical protein
MSSPHVFFDRRIYAVWILRDNAKLLSKRLS